MIYTINGNTISITDGDKINVVQDKDPETGEFFKTPDEAIAWANAYVASLDSNGVLISSMDKLKEEKTAEAKKLYADELAKGFDSAVSGNSSHYAYDEAAATKLTKLFLLRANNMLTYPTPVFTVDNVMQQLTADQITALLEDVAKFEWAVQLKFHNLMVAIDSCEDAVALEALEIKFE